MKIKPWNIFISVYSKEFLFRFSLCLPTWKKQLFTSPFSGNKLLMLYICGILSCLLNLINLLYFKPFCLSLKHSWRNFCGSRSRFQNSRLITTSSNHCRNPKVVLPKWQIGVYIYIYMTIYTHMYISVSVFVYVYVYMHTNKVFMFQTSGKIWIWSMNMKFDMTILL